MPNRHDAQAIPVNSKQRRLIQASVVADARSVHAPGVVLLEGRSVVAAGSPESVGLAGPDAVVEDWTGHLVCPPMVNAHVHLDLTDLEPLPQALGFDAWLEAIIAHRGAQQAPGRIEAAVDQGIRASLAGGCPFVGDVCGSLRAFEALRGGSLCGTGFIELFGHGPRAVEAITRIQEIRADSTRDSDSSAIEVGLSPHAPYSAGPEVFEAAAASGLRISTHLAESPEELDWCQDGGGPFGRRLEQMGYAAEDVTVPAGHPLDVYPPLLPARSTLVAHANYATPDQHALLARNGLTVVYCPRAYRYFGHPQAGHASHGWKAMLEAGVPVALGTDGRPCLPASGAAAGRLSVIDEVACLQEDEAVRVKEWLPMVTVHGARALGIPEDEVLLSAGAKRALPVIGLDPLDSQRIDATQPIIDVLAT